MGQQNQPMWRQNVRSRVQGSINGQLMRDTTKTIRKHEKWSNWCKVTQRVIERKGKLEDNTKGVLKNLFTE